MISDAVGIASCDDDAMARTVPTSAHHTIILLRCFFRYELRVDLTRCRCASGSHNPLLVWEIMTIASRSLELVGHAAFEMLFPMLRSEQLDVSRGCASLPRVWP